MSVVFWVGSDVLENEGTGSGHNEHLEHEVIECFKEYGAECLGLDWLAIVVAKESGSTWECVPCDALGQIRFKLVTDAFDTYTQKNRLQTCRRIFKLTALC